MERTTPDQNQPNYNRPEQSVVQPRRRGNDMRIKPSDVKEEGILFMTHPCRRGWHTLKRYIFAFAVLAFGFSVTFVDGVRALLAGIGFDLALISYASLLIFALIIIDTELLRRSIKYYITPSRVVEERGIISKKTDSLHLSIADTIRVETSIVDRLLKMGDLEIAVVDSKIVFKDIHDPNSLKTYIAEVINTYKRRHISF